ncbi:MAG: Glycosyl transferase group 1 [Candidatus Magasanikbacteria bacterium GW2011_GWA2_56_11]|uniref:Glycosyl transferase group 1 n=1 Tax=Candidatus Magasanikbacteria bacterium GW2011_GWA2_56_11 TaxID=1619044 RepID=A0A0G1YI93_9BACT|nr:MAG: Glycosyl transferase group 1 [Candidatus Magasanikbacteria bacterium GW2011_GWA2_56_11]
MRLSIDTRSLLPRARTGVGEYTFELLSALFSRDQKNDYFLFSNSYGQHAQPQPWRQANVHYRAKRWPNRLLNASTALWRRPQLDRWIAADTASEPDWFFAPALNFTAISPRTKYILTVHDLAFALFPDCFSRKMRLWHRFLAPRRQCARADIILTPSLNTKRDLVEKYGVGEDKVRVLYPGLGTEFLRAVPPSAGTAALVRKKYRLPESFILFLGTIEPRKNLLGLIEAYKLLQTDSGFGARNPALVIAGAPGWKSREVYRLLSQTPGVLYVGYVSPADKPALYSLAELFVYPSLYEGFGFPVLEAMAAGVPVITSHRSSLSEVSADAAYLINPYDIADIARAMKLMLTDNTARDWHRRRGRAQAEKFTWDRAARQFMEIIG